MLFGLLKKKSYPSVERRKEVRYEAEDEFIIEFSENNSHYIGNGRDISVNGVRFATTCKLKKGQKINLNLRLPGEFPGEKRLTVKAHVARVYKPLGTTRYRIGCSLKHEKESTREIMQQFIYWLGNKTA